MSDSKAQKNNEKPPVGGKPGTGAGTKPQGGGTSPLPKSAVRRPGGVGPAGNTPATRAPASAGGQKTTRPPTGGGRVSGSGGATPPTRPPVKTPAARPAGGTPAAKPVGTPAARSAGTPAARSAGTPAGTPAAKPAAVPAAAPAAARSAPVKKSTQDANQPVDISNEAEGEIDASMFSENELEEINQSIEHFLKKIKVRESKEALQKIIDKPLKKVFLLPAIILILSAGMLGAFFLVSGSIGGSSPNWINAFFSARTSVDNTGGISEASQELITNIRDEQEAEVVSLFVDLINVENAGAHSLTATEIDIDDGVDQEQLQVDLEARINDLNNQLESIDPTEFTEFQEQSEELANLQNDYSNLATRYEQASLQGDQYAILVADISDALRSNNLNKTNSLLSQLESFLSSPAIRSDPLLSDILLTGMAFVENTRIYLDTLDALSETEREFAGTISDTRAEIEQEADAAIAAVQAEADEAIAAAQAEAEEAIAVARAEAEATIESSRTKTEADLAAEAAAAISAAEKQARDEIAVIRAEAAASIEAAETEAERAAELAARSAASASARSGSDPELSQQVRELTAQNRTLSRENQSFTSQNETVQRQNNELAGQIEELRLQLDLLLEEARRIKREL